MFKYEITLPEGARSITLPENPKIKIFAITVADIKNEDVIPFQLLYDDFRNDKPVQLRIKEYVTPEMQSMKYLTKPLFSQNIDPRQLSRVKAYMKNIGADTVIVQTLPSVDDYADKNSGNGVTATYYANGKSKSGIEYKNQKFDLSNILNSGGGKLKDTVLFDNGEGRIIIDLRKVVNIDKVNMYFDQFRNRGSQIFTMWASSKDGAFTGDPSSNGWRYIGPYGISGRGVSSSGASVVFDKNLQCRLYHVHYRW